MLSLRSMLIGASLVALAGVATPAVNADIIQTFDVVNANVGDGTNLADATIAFDVSAASNTVQVTITNASVMHAANELLRSVSFDVQTSGGSAPSAPSGLALSDGQSVTVASGGAATTTPLAGLSALGANAWTISPSPSGPGDTSTFLLSSSGPKYLVIGPSPYVDANSSIAGNPAHSVFIGNSPVLPSTFRTLPPRIALTMWWSALAPAPTWYRQVCSPPAAFPRLPLWPCWPLVQVYYW